MKAADILDAGGTTEYEREQKRKRQKLVAAAMPEAVRVFGVPTTALIKAGQFQRALMIRRKKRPEPLLPEFKMPQGPLSRPGYGPMQSAQLAGVAAQYAAVVTQAVRGPAAGYVSGLAAPGGPTRAAPSPPAPTPEVTPAVAPQLRPPGPPAAVGAAKQAQAYRPPSAAQQAAAAYAAKQAQAYKPPS